MSDLTGGCQCGQVRFIARGAPKFAFICQCRSCQHLTGSGHAVQFCHDKSAFAVTGPLATWDRQTPKGETVTKAFCPDCGCPLFGTTTRAPGIVMALAGALDDPSSIRPDRIFFADEAQPWDHAQVAPRVPAVTPTEFEAIAERLTKSLLTGDFELYQTVISLPFRSIPRGGDVLTQTTPTELRKLFDSYCNALSMRQVTDIYREILSITRMDDDWVEVSVETHFMSGAQRIADPIGTQFVLRPEGGAWRISAIRSSSGLHNWAHGTAILTSTGQFELKRQRPD